MNDKLYIVEIRFGKKGGYLPTTKWHLSRDAARQEIKEWKETLEGASFRILKYRNPKVVR